MITDRRASEFSGNHLTFGTEIVSWRDDYPFGMQMPGRNFSTDAYRFGFQGKESDDEVYGTKNSLDFGARVYDPRVGRWNAVDPLANSYVSWSPYNYVMGNPIRNTDPDGRSVKTDYYNLQGKHVKHVDDGSTAKKLVLIWSKKADKVDATISGGGVAPVPSNAVVDQMESAILASNEKGNEHGFYVGNSGGTSITVEGDSRNIDDDAWNIAKADLRSKGDLISYDVHTHLLKKDDNGSVIGIGLPRPSETDKNYVVGNQPSVVLGQKEVIKPLPNGQIGGTPEVEYKPAIGFYNSRGLINGSTIEFSDYKRAVNKINKQ